LPPDDEHDLDRITTMINEALQSRVRRLALSVLKRSGTSMPISEIARKCNSSPNQVAGAIRGTKGQYKPELSLLRLGLVSETVSKIPGTREHKTYRFNVKSQALLDIIERVLARYRTEGEE
jgi:predicted transcriptional regulator with HTH domain